MGNGPTVKDKAMMEGGFLVSTTNDLVLSVGSIPNSEPMVFQFRLTYFSDVKISLYFYYYYKQNF
jgi:hypothetical protein